MKTTKYKMIEPNYVEKFKCVGAKCEDTCCAGWEVEIDQTTHKKYKRVKHFQLAGKIKNNIIIKKDDRSSNVTIKMKLDKERRCNFLTEEGWCEIQSKLGETYLGDVCATYPRAYKNINGVLERRLTLSCPEAARLILLNKEGIELCEYEKTDIKERLVTGQALYTSEALCHEKYFYEMRYVTLCILKARNYSIETRLMILGMMYDTISQLDSVEMDTVPDILGGYLDGLQSNVFETAFDEILPRIDLQVRLGQELILMRLNESVSSEKYLKYSREIIEGLKIGDEREKEKQFIKSYEEVYKRFIEENEYFIENYLVNYAFSKTLPLGGENVFDSYTMLIINYAIIKYHLIGIGAYRQLLDVQLAVEVVQVISKVFEHNPRYFKEIMTTLKKIS